MKKIFILFALIMSAVIVLAVAYQSGAGRGGYFTATTTAQQITMNTTNGMDGAESYVVTVSVQNLGTNNIFVGHDYPNAGMFNKAVVNNEAIPIESMEYYDFNGARILSIWVKTTSSIAPIKIAGH